MAILFSFFIFFFFLSLSPPQRTLAGEQSCRPTCGSLKLKYPFGSGCGCGSPRFHPYVTCEPTSNQLTLTTHTGSYPITSISYATSTLTITPPYMSTCNTMQQSPNLGLDWTSPFQLGPSTFLLLSCPSPTCSLAINGSPVCDSSSSHLCDSIYTCPSVTGLGLPIFPPSNTCCVYSPANFNSKGELDLRSLKCEGYTSIVSLQDYPTDPNQWQYGVLLKYAKGAFDSYDIDNKCNACEESGGVCGYAPPGNSFICACDIGYNTTTQCRNFFNNDQEQEIFWSSASLQICKCFIKLY